MSLTLRSAAPSDIETMVDIYMAAFAHDLVSVSVFPRNEPSSRQLWLDMFHEEITDPKAHFLVVSPVSQPGLVIAFAKWNEPQLYPEGSLPQWPTGADVGLANHFFGTLDTKKKDIMGERRYWYLELVATIPEWQGKGAAAMLLRWGLQKTDAEGIECYLEGSPDGVPIYEHFGFREVDRLIVGEEGEFVEVFMIRDKKGSSS